MSEARRRSPDELGDEDRTLLRLLSSGQTTAAVATRLDCSERTVRRRLRGVCDELGVRSSMEAVVLAVRHRII
jgi:DNA-binding NarL/FixJ family response regulator